MIGKSVTQPGICKLEQATLTLTLTLTLILTLTLTLTLTRSAPHFDTLTPLRGPTVFERVLGREPPRPPQAPMSVSSFTTSVASSN